MLYKQHHNQKRIFPWDSGGTMVSETQLDREELLLLPKNIPIRPIIHNVIVVHVQTMTVGLTKIFLKFPLDTNLQSLVLI